MQVKKTPFVLIYGSNYWYHAQISQYPKEDQEALRLSKDENQTRTQIYLRDLDAFTSHLIGKMKNTAIIFQLQDLVYPTGFRYVTNRKVDMYNKLASMLLKQKYPRVIVWDSGRALTEVNFSKGSLMLTNGTYTWFNENKDEFKLQLQFLFNFIFNENCERPWMKVKRNQDHALQPV